MRRTILLPALVAALLAACDSPGPLSPYSGVPPARVSLGGSDFTVRVAGRQAQAVRTDVDLAAAFARAEIMARAGLAIEQVSGCRVLPGTLSGDAAVIEAELAC